MYKLDRVAGGGCFWLADTPAADRLLETWIEECDASFDKGIDDVILTHVLDRMPEVRETKLPDEYLSVEGLCTLDEKTDVVRHLQYSRKSVRLNYNSYH